MQQLTIADIQTLAADELRKAERKFPEWRTDAIHAAAIVGEEAGELTRAALIFTYEGGDIEEIKKEAVQTLVTCIRLLKNLHELQARPYTNKASELAAQMSFGMLSSEERRRLYNMFDVARDKDKLAAINADTRVIVKKVKTGMLYSLDLFDGQALFEYILSPEQPDHDTDMHICKCDRCLTMRIRESMA